MFMKDVQGAKSLRLFWNYCLTF